MQLLWKDGQKSRERIRKKHFFLLKMDYVPWEKKAQESWLASLSTEKKLNELSGGGSGVGGGGG